MISSSKNIIRILYKGSDYQTKKSLLSIYYAFIHTYVNYADLEWASTIRTNLKKVHNLQNQRIDIFICKDTLSCTKGLFFTNKVFNVYQLNILNNVIFMRKVKSKTTPAVFLPKFQEQAHPYPTNFWKLNYIKPTSQLSRSNFRISERGAALQNEFLTDSEREIENISLFKSKLKFKLLSYENKLIFCKDLHVHFHTSIY